MASRQKTVGDAPTGKKPWIAALSAWLIPGGGHLYLGHRGRALGFLAIFLACLWIGCDLDGQLATWASSQPLSPLRVLGLLDSWAMGVSYFLLTKVVHYQGVATAPGFEYGSTFLVTAGLMNVLLILDAWDLAHGRDRAELAGN